MRETSSHGLFLGIRATRLAALRNPIFLLRAAVPTVDRCYRFDNKMKDELGTASRTPPYTRTADADQSLNTEMPERSVLTDRRLHFL